LDALADYHIALAEVNRMTSGFIYADISSENSAMEKKSK
jgi:hypothetical protein